MMDTIREFSSIPINHSEIPQGELNIDNKTRSNLFNWNGQFSPQFIEALLKKYAEKDFMVIDPFSFLIFFPSSSQFTTRK